MSFNVTCPPPFVLATEFPPRGGHIGGRFCAQIPLIPGQPTCCLPCPKQNFFYPDHFETLIHTTTFINLASVLCCCFLLLSFAVLPIELTHRHYLSVCLTLAILLMQMSFVIPFGQKAQCYDHITPHDMYSSLNCALSGSFLLGGGFCTVMWAFLRTLSLHLQICWKVVPGRKFFFSAQAVGWSIPVVFVATALSLTGVSFRFGESCHINSKNGLQTFWGPLLAVAAASIVTQMVTFGYCVQVYLRSLFDDKPGATFVSSKSQPLPYSNSIRTAAAVQAFRRVQRVIALQWRGIMVIFIIIADVVFFATVFLRFDGITQRTPETERLAGVWLRCMIFTGGQKNMCLPYASKLVVAEGTALAVMFLLSFNGIWALILLGRVPVLKGWVDFFKNTFRRWRGDDMSGRSQDSSSYIEDTQPANYDFQKSDPANRNTASTAELNILKPESSLTSLPHSLHSHTSPTHQHNLSYGDINLGLNSLHEYNPSTFSARLRERAGGDPLVPQFSSPLQSSSNNPSNTCGTMFPYPSPGPYSNSLLRSLDDDDRPTKIGPKIGLAR